MARNYAEQRLQFRMVTDLRWLLPRDAVLMMIPNGGDMTDGARKKAAGLGEHPGASDLLVVCGGKALFLELKVTKSEIWNIPKTTNQRPNQIEFQSAIEAAGGHYAVVRSVDEAAAFLALHGVPMRLSASSVRQMA